MQHTFHVVALPHTNVTRQFQSCAFTQKVRRFCQMMKACGHRVYLYAGMECDVETDGLVALVTEAERQEMVGGRHYTQADWGDPLWATFNQRVIAALRDHPIQPHDFICLIGGVAQKPIADAFPAHMSVEFGIGYAGTFAKFRVFESYAWMHTIYGADTGGNAGAADGRYFDAVIPNQIDDDLYADLGVVPSDDHALFVGRLIDRKGYRLAQEVCEAANIGLFLAGPGEPNDGWGEFLGEIDAQLRTDYMRKATCLIAPTQYIEPFGTVHIEALAAGCPVVAPDWGVFTETIQNGKNGWRCRTFKEYVDAVKASRHLGVYRRSEIADAARSRYSMARVGLKYETYFNRLSTLWGDGFYAR